MMDPRQGASVNLKLGYRNLFGYLDTTTLDYNRAISQKQNTLNIQTAFPFFLKESQLTIGYANTSKDLLPDLREYSNGHYIQLQTSLYSLIYTHMLRRQDSDDFLPNIKHSLKIQGNLSPLFNNGKHLNYGLELGRFGLIKADLGFRKYFAWNQRGLEIQSKVGGVKGGFKNDFFSFQGLRSIQGSYLTKNYGFLGLKWIENMQGGGMAFIYNDFWYLDHVPRMTFGVGVGFEFGEAVRLEMLYGVIGKKRNGGGGFQLRISVND